MNAILPGASGCVFSCKGALTSFHSLLILSKGFPGLSPAARRDVEDTCSDCSRPQKTSNWSIQLIANHLGPTSLVVLSKGFVGQRPATRCSHDFQDTGRGWRIPQQVIQLIGDFPESSLGVGGLQRHLQIQIRNMRHRTGEKYTS